VARGDLALKRWAAALKRWAAARPTGVYPRHFTPSASYFQFFPLKSKCIWTCRDGAQPLRRGAPRHCALKPLLIDSEVLGSRNGFGTHVYTSGDQWDGVWVGDKAHGAGLYIAHHSENKVRCAFIKQGDPIPVDGACLLSLPCLYCPALPALPLLHFTKPRLLAASVLVEPVWDYPRSGHTATIVQQLAALIS